MPELTRRRDPEAPDECWHVYHGDVRVGTIAKRVGIPFDEELWGWLCGFYPGCHPRERTDGTAATFNQARTEFEEAWQVFLSNRTEATSPNGAINGIGSRGNMPCGRRGEKLPSQRPNTMMRCPCGETFDGHRLEHTVIHVPHISAAHRHV
jgi:hypothetical protein